MLSAIDLFHVIRDRIYYGDYEIRNCVELVKWKSYTWQYEGGFGIRGTDSRLTVWQYNRVIIIVNCKRLTINDPEKIQAKTGEDVDTFDLIKAIEDNEIRGIGSIALLWRITIGGYIARKRHKGESKS